ncbi:unnamed protein product [Haemonchus placei]|uniref:Secreted protein n=1 Tax=Haemonchus placei TaxID=6290 RepID=A0A0N4X736_HAEPC|nr:unnamed protein product [Haemonchus placei]
MNLFVILSVVVSLATISVDAGTGEVVSGHSSDSSQQTSGLPLMNQPFPGRRPDGGEFHQGSRNDKNPEDPVNLIQEGQEATLSVDSEDPRLEDQEDSLLEEPADQVKTLTGNNILELKEEIRSKDLEDHSPENEGIIRPEDMNDHFQEDQEDTRSEDLEELSLDDKRVVPSEDLWVVHVADIEDFLREDPMDGSE